MFNPSFPTRPATSREPGLDTFKADVLSPTPPPQTDPTRQQILEELKAIHHILRVFITTLQRSGIPGLAEIDISDIA